MKKYAGCLILILTLFQTAFSKTYTVHTQQEFKTAINKAIAGDQIIIGNGTYTEWAVTASVSGTKAKPVSIFAETHGKVVFTGNVDQPIFQLTGSYITLSGIAFTDCSLLKTKGQSGVLVELKNAVNCRLTQCVFEKNTAKAQFMPLVVISGAGNYNRVDSCSFLSNIDNQEVQVKITKDECPINTLIENNLFKDKSKVTWKVFNGGECVQVGQDPVLRGIAEAKAIVRYNKFIRCKGEAEVISNKSSGNSYIKNYFEDCEGELVMRGGHDCLIDSNIFSGGSGGIRINGTGHTVTHNTITNIKTAIRLMYGMGKGKQEIGFYIAASNCIIKNNRIENAVTGILAGDSKNADWTGKFDTSRYPSRVMQDVAPFDNQITDNVFVHTEHEMVTN